MITLPSDEGTLLPQSSLQLAVTLAAQTSQVASRFASLHEGSDVGELGNIQEKTKSLYSLLCKLNIPFGNHPFALLAFYLFY
jgi:hypothetical protein